MAFSVCIVSVMRIFAFAHSNQKDPTYTTIDTAMWSSIEQSLGIVCTCLPTLRPILLWIWRKCPGSGRPASIPLHIVSKESKNLHRPFRSSPSERRMLQSSEGEPSLKKAISADAYSLHGDKVGEA